MSDYGIKVSRENKDVTAYSGTSSNLLFNSETNIFKVLQTGSLSTSVAGGNIATITITHGLSYAPNFDIYGSSFADGTWTRGTGFALADTTFQLFAFFAQSAVNTLTVSIINQSSTTQTWTGSYYIYGDSING